MTYLLAGIVNLIYKPYKIFYWLGVTLIAMGDSLRMFGEHYGQRMERVDRHKPVVMEGE